MQSFTRMSKDHHTKLWEAFRERIEAAPDDAIFKPLDKLAMRHQFCQDLKLAYAQNVEWFIDRWGGGMRPGRLARITKRADKRDMLLIVNYLIDGSRMLAELKERDGWDGDTPPKIE